MTVTMPMDQVDPTELELLRQVHQHWNNGNQPQALELLRPLADDERPWATALTAWLMMQQGMPGIEQSASYALKAAALGMPWQAVHTFNNLVGLLPQAPQLADRLIELAAAGLPWQPGIDPVGQGWNLIGQGQAELGMRLMSMTSQVPIAPAGWEPIMKQAQDRVRELGNLTTSAREERERVSNEATDAVAAIAKAQSDLETSASQAGLLVTAATSDATNALFKEDAKRNQKESRTSWFGGLIVLGAAAIVAILPLILHYRGEGPGYSTTALLGAHIASTLALATFAGVLLARARTRDLASQRANDLSTAMGTMISYSNQIKDPVERERFMMTMGQLVLQAHLTTGSGNHTKDDSLPGLLALANLLKPTAASANPSP